MRSAEFTLGSYACSSSTCASRLLVLAVCAEPESVEAVLPCTHVSNELSNRIEAVWFLWDCAIISTFSCLTTFVAASVATANAHATA